MATLTVVGFDKKKAGEIQAPDSLVNAELRRDILQTVVRWQLACRRAGTVATKTKGLVRGGGKKPFKQKGTGEARQGSSRSPLMPGGGTAFGPQPRDYSYTLPKKLRDAGLKVALSYLNKENRLVVVDSIESDGKTKKAAKALKNFGLSKAVVCDDAGDEKAKRSMRNLKDYKYLSVGGLNVFDLLKYDGCVISKGALSKLAERLGE